MTQRRNIDEADADVRALRAHRPMRRTVLGRMMWLRVLPGSVAVVAALTLPEFSVGAGDLAGGDRFDNPPKPPSAAGQGRVMRGSGAANPVLAGVRYAPILDLRGETTAFAPTSPRIAHALASSAGLDESLSAAGEPIDEPVVRFAALPAAPLAEVLAELPPAASAPLSRPSVMSLSDEAVAALAAVPPQSSSAIAAVDPSVAFASAAAPLPEGQGAEIEAALTMLVPAPSPAVAALAAPPPAGATGEARSGMAQLTTVLVAPRESAPISANPPIIAPAAIVATAPAIRPPVLQPAPAMVAAAVPVPKPPPTAPGLRSGNPFPLDIKSQLIARVDGKSAGAVDFAQTETGLKVRLGSIVELLGDRYDSAQLARIKASPASNNYLLLAELQAQGIPISYDPVYDEFNVGLTDTRPKDARKVHMDQITAPERGAATTGIDQVRP